MEACCSLHTNFVVGKNRRPFIFFSDRNPPQFHGGSGHSSTLLLLPQRPLLNRRASHSCLGHTDILRLRAAGGALRVRALNTNIGAGSYEGDKGNGIQKTNLDGSLSGDLSESRKPQGKLPFSLSLVGVLALSTLAVVVVSFIKGGPSSVLAAISKSGVPAAFSLIFVSEIGDKTFFIAALLAMQYGKGPVLLGSMGALSLMTILSVVIGRIFHSVPAQFQTTLPIGEYAAVALLLFFGFKSIKNAWDIPSEVAKSGKDGPELGEYVEAEELVKEKVAKKLATTPIEIIWKSFSLVFFAEWGDRSMLATIALGAAQSPWGVASGAIAGHLVATSLAIVGGSVSH
ncbi:hypothetical protein AMTR_s00039p00041910 [Amborella trichopoda]|uniref:GDT1 family protein n=1 Tax=Amborella trichopoda TaxID=13333 RepID=U5D5V1_AMBTC|nr:hypothetical protein AMTR_s00039p00041910 [Amborella trichopoda]